MQIRHATLLDCRALAELHVASWHETYRDLAPPDVLRQLDVDRRLQLWQRILATESADHLYLIAEIEGTPVAFGGAGPSSNAVFDGRGEIKMLYVAQSAQRRGIGRRLMQELASFLYRTAHAGAALAVVEGNTPAIAFYESLGARQIGAFVDPGPLWRSNNLVYAWDDITALIESSR